MTVAQREKIKDLQDEVAWGKQYIRKLHQSCNDEQNKSVRYLNKIAELKGIPIQELSYR